MYHHLLDAVLIFVLIVDIAVNLMRWRSDRLAARAAAVDPDTEPPLYDDGPGPEPWQRGAP